MINVNADFLIDRRKRQWEVHHDIKKDELFCFACANEIINNSRLRAEIVEYPEKLIELIFKMFYSLLFCKIIFIYFIVFFYV